MKCLLFNPDNDLALATGKPNYTPPTRAMQLRQAGSILPLWYGQPGDRVLTYGVNNKWLENMIEDFALEVDVFDHANFDLEPDPWGWSCAAKKTFVDEGFPSTKLPTDEYLKNHRKLSSRLSSIAIGEALAQCGISSLVDGYAVACHNIGQIKRAIEAKGDFVAKQPWSSSGRGIANSFVMGQSRALKFAEDSCRTQGCVLIETAYEKLLDFAKLFYIENGKCDFIGTSIFDTDPKGAYTGNLLDSEENKNQLLANICNASSLNAVREFLRRQLESHYGAYTGIIGVDMLITKQGLIYPLVEVNLRKTMGYVSLCLTNGLLPQGVKGHYVVRPNHGVYTQSDYQIENHKLIGGTLNLVPPNSNFDFLVTIDK